MGVLGVDPAPHRPPQLLVGMLCLWGMLFFLGMLFLLGMLCLWGMLFLLGTAHGFETGAKIISGGDAHTQEGPMLSMHQHRGAGLGMSKG